MNGSRAQPPDTSRSPIDHCCSSFLLLLTTAHPSSSSYCLLLFVLVLPLLPPSRSCCCFCSCCFSSSPHHLSLSRRHARQRRERRWCDVIHAADARSVTCDIAPHGFEDEAARAARTRSAHPTPRPQRTGKYSRYPSHRLRMPLLIASRSLLLLLPAAPHVCPSLLLAVLPVATRAAAPPSGMLLLLLVLLLPATSLSVGCRHARGDTRGSGASAA